MSSNTPASGRGSGAVSFAAADAAAALASDTAPGTASAKQNDTMLWLAGALVAGVGVTWFLISQPWLSGSSAPAEAEAPAASAETTAKTAATAETAQTAVSAADAANAANAAAAANTTSGASTASAENGTPAAAGTAHAELEVSLDGNPLRMAELALEAGMLIEPEGYSAWTLYRRALEQAPDSAEAKQGLAKIAAELVRRAGAAIEQGRFDDARKTVDRIHEALPDDAGAKALAARLDELAPKKVVTSRTASTAGTTAATAAEETAEKREAKPKKADAAPKPAAPLIDPVVEARDAFAGAVLANHLLTPADSSAKHFVNVLTAIAPAAAATQDARKQLFDKFISRADESLVALDIDAANTWIDEANRLEVDPSAVEAERQKLTDQLVKIESSRRLPASEFKVVSYTAPIYPQRALERGMSGWVDVEFTVGRDGTTHDVVVTDASTDRYFRDEAVEAVEKWRFEPRVFMDRTIEQRAYSRIRFDIAQ
jgi:TonB family protein